jgi:hypothetical protein
MTVRLTVPRIDRKRPPVPACKQACLHAGVTVLVQYRYRTGIPTVYRVYSRTAVLLAVTGGRSLGTVREIDISAQGPRNLFLKHLAHHRTVL